MRQTHEGFSLQLFSAELEVTAVSSDLCHVSVCWWFVNIKATSYDSETEDISHVSSDCVKSNRHLNTEEETNENKE